VARYKHLSLEAVIEEMLICSRSFYSLPRVLGRVGVSFRQRRSPIISLLGNLSYRRNYRLDAAALADFRDQPGSRRDQ